MTTTATTFASSERVLEEADERFGAFSTLDSRDEPLFPLAGRMQGEEYGISRAPFKLLSWKVKLGAFIPGILFTSFLLLVPPADGVQPNAVAVVFACLFSFAAPYGLIVWMGKIDIRYKEAMKRHAIIVRLYEEHLDRWVAKMKDTYGVHFHLPTVEALVNGHEVHADTDTYRLKNGRLFRRPDRNPFVEVPRVS